MSRLRPEAALDTPLQLVAHPLRPVGERFAPDPQALGLGPAGFDAASPVPPVVLDDQLPGLRRQPGQAAVQAGEPALVARGVVVQLLLAGDEAGGLPVDPPALRSF